MHRYCSFFGYVLMYGGPWVIYTLTRSAAILGVNIKTAWYQYQYLNGAYIYDQSGIRCLYCSTRLGNVSTWGRPTCPVPPEHRQLLGLVRRGASRTMKISNGFHQVWIRRSLYWTLAHALLPYRPRFGLIFLSCDATQSRTKRTQRGRGRVSRQSL